MKKLRDYAKTEHMNSWLRHPVLGDPSFDSFEHFEKPVLRGEPPYEWPVDGSLFRDFDGTWYLYAGLYLHGYAINPDNLSRARILRSTDQGKTWEDLGWVFEKGFCYEGDKAASDCFPDCVVVYDKKLKKYLMTLDGTTNDVTWESMFNFKRESLEDSGAGVALADSPAGPFERFPARAVSMRNNFHDKCGRYCRCYFTTILPREHDYLALALCDSNHYYAWGLSVMTAPTLEGPWSDAHMVLSCDRPEYYPCPVEFQPVEEHDGIVYASASSIAGNRDYQCVFTAPLEEAHLASAWKLEMDGNTWHSEDTPDEHYGIWGQTYHGFVDPDTGKYVVMFPTKDTENRGNLMLASRPWDQPWSDGFVVSGHVGPSVSPMLAAYRDFSLNATVRTKGTADIAFAYEGILGPNNCRATEVVAASAVSDYTAVRFREGLCQVVSVAGDGTEKIYAEAAMEKAEQLFMEWKDDHLTVKVNDILLCEKMFIPEAAGKTSPLAVIVQSFSRLACDQFAVEGDPQEYCLRYLASDAILGAGQMFPEKEIVDPLGEIKADNRWHRTVDGFVGEGKIAAKWNVIGSALELPLKKSPVYGMIGIWIDGYFHSTVNLRGEGETVWRADGLKMGPHSVKVEPVEPLQGRIAITELRVYGNKEAN